MASGTVRELLELHRTHLVTACELTRHAVLLNCCSDVLNLSCPLHPSLLSLEAEDLRACRHHLHAIWQFPTQGAVRRRCDDQQMPVTQGGWACGDHNQELAAMPPKPRWIAAELSRVACLDVHFMLCTPPFSNKASVASYRGFAVVAASVAADVAVTRTRAP